LKLKTASFTVRATMPQSIAWKRAADAEGFPSCGAWLSRAADAYLRLRAKAGLPLPLAWARGTVRVDMEGATGAELRGWTARPFGIFRGSPTGPKGEGCKVYTLVYLPARRIVATFKYARQCRALAAELAAVYARSDGEGDIRAGPLIDRHEREAT
jgi:hypothetical protein